ncbi:hypothetical protein RRG08_050637 [Elysia crispata]|uniref:Uncharacterized protein n=1 Tax=Elysia crispata TaxID=231223 RepID=A0AAE1D9C8_9GAST|nr:hypothetical protein RRG08_050637 [Elysia crispata]
MDHRLATTNNGDPASIPQLSGLEDTERWRLIRLVLGPSMRHLPGDAHHLTDTHSKRLHLEFDSRAPLSQSNIPG